MVRFLFSLSVLFGTLLVATEIEKPPKGNPAGVFAARLFADAGAVQAVIAPMKGSAPAVLRRGDAGAFLELPINFSTPGHSRASWDFSVSADLTLARGVEFDFYCSDLSLVSHFNLYFHSADGWYSSSFGVDREGSWNRVFIDKSTTKSEERPGGWRQIDTIRVSCWRGGDRDGACAIANLRMVGGKPEILVVRAESLAVAGNSEAKSLLTFAGAMASCLQDLDANYAVVSDLNVTEKILAACKIVILPYNPKLPESLLPLLENFVEKGGRLFAFYSLPKGVPELIGVKSTGWVPAVGGKFSGMRRRGTGVMGQPEFVGQRSWATKVVEPALPDARVVATWCDGSGKDTGTPAVVLSDRGGFMGHVWLKDDWGNKKALLLAMLGKTLPDVWRRAAAVEYAKIGVFGRFDTFGEFEASFSGSTSTSVLDELRKCREGRGKAERLQRGEQWHESILASRAAAASAVEAWCMTRTSRPGEFRAFWCHRAYGIRGKSWDESIRFLAAHGFNAILPNMLWGGVAYYPSEVLPTYAGFDKEGDRIAECLAACKKYGVECHVWKVNWNMGSRADKDFVKRMVAAQRVQKGFSGEVKERWLCPSHPLNQQLEIAAMVEVARKYAVDGVHFDYIRYPNGSFCFCDGCRERFENILGHKVENWPEATREDENIKAAWLEFRRGNITSVVKKVAEQVHALRPGCKISAAVFRNWSNDRDRVGQDWKVWCDRGWLDFVCPMDYTDHNSVFQAQVERQKAWAGKVPLYPGIGLSCWRDPGDSVKLIEQIEITRKFGCQGFTVFEYGDNAFDVLPELRLGCTSK